MDWKENEVREDLDRVRAMIDALKLKYGEDFSCVWTAGCNIGEAWAGEAIIAGEPAMLHMACHGLLDAPKFVDEICDTIKCVLHNNQPENMPKLIVQAMESSINSLKKVLLMSTKEYKKRMEEKEIEENVQELVNSVFHKNDTIN